MKLLSIKNFSSAVSFCMHICLLIAILSLLHGNNRPAKSKYIVIGLSTTVENNSNGKVPGTVLPGKYKRTSSGLTNFKSRRPLKEKEVGIKKIKSKHPEKNSSPDIRSVKSNRDSLAAAGNNSPTGNGDGDSGSNGGGGNTGEEEDVYHVAADQMPVPIGGTESITAKAVYPEAARAEGITGTVYVLAYIDETGTVRKTYLIKGIGFGCDRSAERAIAETYFEPGRDGGVPVKVQMTIAVRFGPGMQR